METKNANPPYVSYSTFRNTLDSLKEKTLPAVIDASVLSSMSGSSRAALVAGLRFLELLTDDDRPTDTFKAIVKASPEERKPLFKSIIEKRYPESSKAVLDGTTMSLKKGFEYDVSEAIKGKCVSFFMGLARDAGLPISAHIDNRVRIKRSSRPRGENIKRRPHGEPKGSNGNGHSAPDLRKEGKEVVPITLGIGKVWEISVDAAHTDDDIYKFTEMIKLALMKGKK